MKNNNNDATRRQILRTGLAVVSGAVAVSGAQAQDKMDPKIVQYQDTPKDGNKCDACVNWEPPAACKIVSGKISPNGWCIAYAPMENKKG
jgi:hypothetical protein